MAYTASDTPNQSEMLRSVSADFHTMLPLTVTQMPSKMLTTSLNYKAYKLQSTSENYLKHFLDASISVPIKQLIVCCLNVLLLSYPVFL